MLICIMTGCYSHSNIFSSKYMSVPMGAVMFLNNIHPTTLVLKILLDTKNRIMFYAVWNKYFSIHPNICTNINFATTNLIHFCMEKYSQTECCIVSIAIPPNLLFTCHFCCVSTFHSQSAKPSTNTLNTHSSPPIDSMVVDLLNGVAPLIANHLASLTDSPIKWGK